jgi:hypothetical protein
MSKKNALFFNGDYHLQKPLTVKELYGMPFGEIYEIFHGKYHFLRSNCGNFLYLDALVNLTDSEWVGGNDFNKLAELKPDSVVTAIMAVIEPDSFYIKNTEYWQKLIKTLPDTKIVPISMGFSDYYKNNKIDKDFLAILKAISEKTILGVRGEFSAGVLEKNGINNFTVIGCPSLYYNKDRDFKINKASQKIRNVNFNQNFWVASRVPKYDRITQYFYNAYKNKLFNVNTTLQHTPIQELVIDNCLKWDQVIISKPNNNLLDFKINTGRYFFDTDSWIAALRNDDFSIGTLLHGNIAAVLAGTPALFFRRDERMKEFIDFYKFPSIEFDEFNENKPIEYYFESADYSEFNKNFSKCYDNFIDFCDRNSVALKI